MSNAHFVPQLRRFLLLLDHRLEMLQTLCDSVQTSAGVHVFILAPLVPHGMSNPITLICPLTNPITKKKVARTVGPYHMISLSMYMDTSELQ